MKKFALIILVAVLLTGLLLGGCPAPEETTAPATPDSTAPQGDLVFAVTTLGSELFDVRWQPDCILSVIPYQNLFRSNVIGVEPMGPYPWLAESATQSADGLTWDIYLKQGIQFHNGWGELTAEDVVFTYEEIMKDPANQNPYEYYWLSPEEGGILVSVEEIDKYHVRFNLSVPYNMFREDLQDNNHWILCKEYITTVGTEQAFREPIGTSPWQWVETVPGDHIKFEAVVSDWQKTPEFKTLTFKLVPDASTQLMMLQSGEVDMAVIAPAQAEQADGVGLQVYEVSNQRFIEVVFGGQLMHWKDTFDPTVPWAAHTDEPDTSDWNQRALKVRQALCYAIDPQVILDKVAYGYGDLDVMRDFNKHDPNFKSEWQPYPYDPERAKELLVEAGYPNGFEKPIELLIPAESTTTGVDTRSIMLIVADQLEAVGLEVDRQVMEQSLIDEIYTFGFDSAWKITVTIGYVNWMPVWGGLWCKTSFGPIHVIGESEEFDRLHLEYQEILDPVLAVEKQQELGDYEYSQYMERGLYNASVLYAFGPKIKGVSQPPYQIQHEQPPYFNFEYIERAD